MGWLYTRLKRWTGCETTSGGVRGLDSRCQWRLRTFRSAAMMVPVSPDLPDSVVYADGSVVHATLDYTVSPATNRRLFLLVNRSPTEVRRCS